MEEVVLRDRAATPGLLSPVYYVVEGIFCLWVRLYKVCHPRVPISRKGLMGLCDTDPTGGAVTWRGTGDTHAIVDTVAATGLTSFLNLSSDARRHRSNPVKLEGIKN